MRWVRDCVRDERPDAVAITGDLTMRARRQEFEAACDWILSLEAPVTVEVGNHDLPYFNIVERFVAPYARIRRAEHLVEREILLPGISIVPLKTTARAQWRLNWSKGWASKGSLARTLAQIDALGGDAHTVLVACHHPLVETGTRGTALTVGGERALTELARRKVAAVLSGHVHDAFDLVHQTIAGPIRMIGAGTLSRRIRSTPPSFNQLDIADGGIQLRVRNLEQVPTPAMMIEDVPPNALPPKPGEPAAPVHEPARERSWIEG